MKRERDRFKLSRIFMPSLAYHYLTDTQTPSRINRSSKFWMLLGCKLAHLDFGLRMDYNDAI